MSEIQVTGIEQPVLQRSTFDRSFEITGTYKEGIIYPIDAKLTKPGDVIRRRINTVVRRLPTISPSFEQQRVVFRTFLVPIRTLWKKFPQWLVGHKEYAEEIPFTEDVPRWNIEDINDTAIGTLWEALGYPINCIPTTMPANFKAQAYGYIYDTFMRYKPIQESILVEGEPGTWAKPKLMRAIRDRDYFTTGLPTQQIGTPITLPIMGQTKAEWKNVNLPNQFAQIKGTASGKNSNGTENPNLTFPNQPLMTGFLKINEMERAIRTVDQDLILRDSQPIGLPRSDIISNTALLNQLNNNIVRTDEITSVTISMLRHAIARQQLMEMLARCGLMYTDVLKLNWGTSPSDDILGLPIYIGGSSIPIINQEVLQTSASTNSQPLGQMGGSGFGIGKNDEITIHSREHCVLLTLMYIKTKNIYGSQGMPAEDMFMSNEDMGWIQFQHLSEQPVKKQEILCASKYKPTYDIQTGKLKKGEEDTTAATYNNDTFFYQPMFEHMRRAKSRVFGMMNLEQLYVPSPTTEGTYELMKKRNFYNWTPAKFYSIENGKRPAFNSDFLEEKEDNRNYQTQYLTEYTEDDEKEEYKLPRKLADNFIIWNEVIDEWNSVLDKFGTPGIHKI